MKQAADHMAYILERQAKILLKLGLDKDAAHAVQEARQLRLFAVLESV